MTLKVPIHMDITSQTSLCTSLRALFAASLHFGHLGSIGSWCFTLLGPVLTGVHGCDMLMDDGGPSVCWTTTPDPVPAAAGAQVCPDFREQVLGCAAGSRRFGSEEGISGHDHHLISMAFVLPISYVNALLGLFFWVIYWSELTASERSWSGSLTDWHPAHSAALRCFGVTMMMPRDLDGAGPWDVLVSFVSLCSVCGQANHCRSCRKIWGHHGHSDTHTIWFSCSFLETGCF